MRHRKGHITISVERDIPVLLLVRNARAIRSRQLYEMLLLDGMEPSRPTALWRLTRLIQTGLIGEIGEIRFFGEPVYAITRNGLAMLESHGHSLLSLGSFSKTITPEAEVIHMVELNEIRLALLRSGQLVSWKGELEIISENLALFGEGAKDYDAVVIVEVDGSKRKFAIEYERVAKSGARYEEIRGAIESDHRVDVVLYLTPNQELVYLLSEHLTGISKYIVFSVANMFKTGVLDASVLTTHQGKKHLPLRDMLVFA